MLKLNDVSQKNVEDWYSWLKLHKHDPYEDKDLLKFKNWEIHKKKAETHTGSILNMFEEESLRMSREGMTDTVIAETTYQFHRKIWNHWETDLETRTNNNEGYHHRLSKKIGENPNVWECVEGLQKEEQLIAIDYVLIETGKKKSRGLYFIFNILSSLN